MAYDPQFGLPCLVSVPRKFAFCNSQGVENERRIPQSTGSSRNRCRGGHSHTKRPSLCAARVRAGIALLTGESVRP